MDEFPMPRCGLVIAAVALEKQVDRRAWMTVVYLQTTRGCWSDPGRLNTLPMGLVGRLLDASVPAEASGDRLELTSLLS